MEAQPSKDQSSPPGRRVCDALDRAWTTIGLYDRDHPALLDSLANVVSVCEPLGAQERQLLTDPDAPGLEAGGEDSLRATLCSMDIGALQLGDGLTSELLAHALRSIREARADGAQGGVVAERVDSSAEGTFKLIPLNFAGLAERVTGSQPAQRDACLGIGELRSVLLGATSPESQRSAASWIGRSITEGDASGSVIGEIRAAIRDARSREGEEAGGLDHIRSVLTSLSPEVREGLLTSEDGPDLEALADLAGVVPVMETCEALAQAGLSPDRLCHSTLMMFQRLATLSAGNADELERVGSLAGLVASDTGESQEGQALRSLGELCDQARREEFMPEEYLERLHQISAGQTGVFKDLTSLGWETDALERVRAIEIILDLHDAQIGEATLLPGQLKALTGAVTHAASAGRPDLLIRAIRFAEAHIHDSDAATFEESTALLNAASDITMIAMALSSASSEELLDDCVAFLRERSPQSIPRVLLCAHGFDPRGGAAPWIGAQLAQVGPSLGDEINKMLTSDPGSLEVLLSVVDSLDADTAFRAIQPALLNQDNDEARRGAFAGVYTLRHPWPPDLCHRALVDDDETVRALGVAYIVRRSEENRFSLLGGRLLHTLGGTAPTHDERAMIVNAMFEADSQAASEVLTGALIGAAWRPIGATPGLGRALARAVGQRPVGVKSVVARLLWSASPNHVISSIRRGSGVTDVG